ncbi:hypothetical protein CAOG_005952 [Capsaspora owczarzaki ATCC 30864]|uniref:Choline/carnitine acyltransferase domain-containing protein n=1 Tax=Capsaspora owczarzaki (strain ATCC 30864) TaxID=595528 RepID=A0A0D2X462_CAPO3|nr:hypothetical protein CAOG_005952 [Capsaspora owczarzaki ATCC 30864]
MSLNDHDAAHASKTNNNAAATMTSGGAGAAAAKQPALFAFEGKLPPLPVPNLDTVLDTYLASVQPLLSLPEQSATRAAVDAFKQPGGTGELLHKKLVQRGQERGNWLEDWWLQLAYLAYRETSVINSNTAMTLERDPSNPPPLRQAARYIVKMLEFRELVVSERLQPEFLGKAPLCMNQLRLIFATNRKPGKKIDEQVTYANSRHVVVICRNQFFSFPVLHASGSGGKSLQILSQDEIELQLARIKARAARGKSPAIGLLTADNRTRWAENREQLSQHAGSRRTLEVIESALFTVSLDDELALEDGANTALTLHGFGSTRETGNRWFDKSVQLLVSADGQAGINMEHSVADGVAVARLVFHMHGTRRLFNDELSAAQRHERLSKLAEPELLSWGPLPKAVQDGLARVAVEIDALIARTNLSINDYPAYGKELVKAFRVSPDAWFQMALQLGYYRLHGNLTAVYETASTRQFHHGRTETIRSLSQASAAFVRAMTPVNDPRGLDSVRLLKEAIASHVKTTKNAMEGRGVDRPLLGMRMLAIEGGLEVPALFKDPAYSRSTTFRLSTSQVPTTFRVAPAFGPVVPDGYGVCYNVRDDSIVFSVTNFNDSHTDGLRLARAVFQALTDMRAVVEAATRTAKL